MSVAVQLRCNYGAFQRCSSLTSVTLGKNLTTIGVGAFLQCTSLTSITIPDKVTSIGLNAFLICDSLTSVTFENTSGWTADGTEISSDDLADTATAATYLNSTYYGNTWTRSDS